MSDLFGRRSLGDQAAAAPPYAPRIASLLKLIAGLYGSVAGAAAAATAPVPHTDYC